MKEDIALWRELHGMPEPPTDLERIANALEKIAESVEKQEPYNILDHFSYRVMCGKPEADNQEG